MRAVVSATKYWRRKEKITTTFESWHVEVSQNDTTCTLWLFNIAMENGPFIVDFPSKMVIFHSYVTLPEGKNITSELGDI